MKWISWDGLSNAKCKGGLGFRNLHGFNTALLGKQCWKFMHKPQALVSRVFKARYFADVHFLKATNRAGSSFIWAGIHSAKEALKNDFRWVIGDGKEVVAVQDPWLRRKPDYRVENNHMYQGRDEKVADLFLPGTKQWNTDLIQAQFCSEDANAILSTPIPQGPVQDRIAWPMSANGHYDVKSGYRIWSNRRNRPAAVIESTGWS